MVDQLPVFALEVTRVTIEVGVQGIFGTGKGRGCTRDIGRYDEECQCKSISSSPFPSCLTI
jgi:hypothetical protein